VRATETREQVAQLVMSGMPASPAVHTSVQCCDMTSGTSVVYLGNISGGPRYGSSGIVKRTLAQRAVVDMGRIGTWHIPYYLLAALEETSVA
jgi:hypothetical protein